MRRLIVTENMALDGIVSPMGDWFDPAAQDDELLATNHEHQAAADALVLGRQTFEEFQGFWPLQTDDRTGVTDYLNGVDKYVLSTTLESTSWQRSTILRGPAAEELAALKDRPGADIVITGSVTLVQSLWDTGLVDLVRVFLYPAAQGGGRSLFPDGTGPRFTLVDSKVHTSGVVLLTYQPAG
ncbi:dihydrofolate reductase [Nakamurella sp. YIM 132087]|uniref:Dihydrofolate reductase n=1 Tax=Nakamurella alba TaxID=2665158 RepID=A0A7K1FFE7_9ACTN|nr:dihydrofolate reductase family protein [Nakamurella alba]MTD12827.1 dihydrofolate reductase [Nakamurella alba]